jgi:glycerophosphoryl diester phosphodiesterase
MRMPLHPDFLRLPVAHRALHNRALGRPENSRAAVIAAVAAGYAIEIDVQLSRDAHAMVFHDEDLHRLTGHRGRLNTRTAAELATIPLKDSSEGIPSLAEILSLVAGHVPLLIEIKDQHGQMGETDGRLEAATATALTGYSGPVALMSFNPHSMAHMARLAPHLPRGLTTSAFNRAAWHPLRSAVCRHLRGIPDYDRVGASFISHEWRDLARPRVVALAAQGAAILSWTLKSPADEAIARRLATNITFEGYPAAFPA